MDNSYPSPRSQKWSHLFSPQFSLLTVFSSHSFSIELRYFLDFDGVSMLMIATGGLIVAIFLSATCHAVVKITEKGRKSALDKAVCSHFACSIFMR